MTRLSEQELAEAAAEAGITPAELKAALAEKAAEAAGNLPAVPEHKGLIKKTRRGQSAAHAEAVLRGVDPRNGVAFVKRAIEAQLRTNGHMQSPVEAAIIDPKSNLAYHIRAEPDGASGSVVRVDVDPSPRQGRKAFAAVALVSSVVVMGFIGLFSTPWLIAAGATAVLGGLGMRASGRRGIGDAKSVAAKALLEAETGAPLGPPVQALPPQGRQY